MIKDLILVKVPRFFAFLYRLISESFIYATAARFWRAVRTGEESCRPGETTRV